MYPGLGDTPLLETASPFATPPTVIETDITEAKKAMVSGIGMAIGLAIGGAVIYLFMGKKL